MASEKYYHPILLSLIALLVSLFNLQPSNAVKGGYFPHDNGVITASDIDSTLFTHLFCAFAEINSQTNQITIPAGCSSFPQTVKKKNQKVKTLISIGGGTDKPTKQLKAMANNPSSRKAFIQSSINAALSSGFDGLDLDWEQQSTSQEMTDLGQLLTEWRGAIKSNPKSQHLLLTAALRYTARTGTGSNGVPFPYTVIKESLDWVNVMAYDFYGPAWAGRPYKAMPNAALKGMEVSGQNGVEEWVKAGVPAKKLVFGVPFYGYAWELVNANDNRIGAASTGGNTKYGKNGVSYKEIRSFIANNKGAQVRYNSTYVTGYCVSGKTWIGFDGPETVKQKVLYAKNGASLLGYFSWNIAQDHNWALSKQASQTWGT